MTKEEINWLCNFQGIYNTKHEKIYFIGMINWINEERIVPIRDSTNSFSGYLRDSDLLKDEWSFSIPYEE